MENRAILSGEILSSQKSRILYGIVYSAWRPVIRRCGAINSCRRTPSPCPWIFKKIRNPGLQHLINVGPLKQHELSGYYHHSSALILPTLIESFTATYLEAMHFDCPVLTSDLDFAREVCGPAQSILIRGTSIALRDAIVRFRDDPSLQQYLRAQGRIRCSRNIRPGKKLPPSFA